MHTDGKNLSSGMKYGRIPMACPLTRGCRTRFLDMDSYFKMCMRYQTHKSKIWNNTKYLTYFDTCSKCPNYKKPNRLLHRAEVIGLSELAALRKKFSTDSK